uniref:Uncharacterized protein n=1 Tax=Panagrolaimus superbus TaxID=310955 RepID=A0A914YEX1_9BILA
METTRYATPEAEIAALHKIVEELKDDLEDNRVHVVELELDIENIHADYEHKGDLERKANDRLQNEKRELQEQLEGYKVTTDKQKRRIAELEIELEKSFNNERVLRDEIEQLEESQGSAMEKVADMETRLIEMEQRARDADYFPMPIRPITSNGIEVVSSNKINGEIENKSSLKSVTKKKESRNSVQVIDDLIGIIEVRVFLFFWEKSLRGISEIRKTFIQRR